MITYTAVLGWLAVGAAASLAGMIWPFRRGASGVLLNALVAMGGAVFIAMASYLFIPEWQPHASSIRLIFAAVGSWIGLGLAHAAWAALSARTHRKRPHGLADTYRA